jgi:beta-fructofuranosidase
MLHLPESWVWDSWFAFDGENHHVFYLRASRALLDPNRRHRQPYIGHAISKDLKNWTVVQDAIAISDPPAFDSWTTWTGSVVRDEEGLWWMFYTGTSREDLGVVQKIGSATSKDLLTWVKSEKNPVSEAEAPFYELHDEQKSRDEAWRDPWVFFHENKWHMLITANAATGNLDSRGVAGHAISQDLVEWEVLPPITVTNSGFGQMEVIQVEIIDGKPTMIWCCGFEELDDEAKKRYGKGGVFSVTGDSLLGPFDPKEAILFPHDSLYASRAVQHEGKWYMIGFINEVDGKFVGDLTDPLPIKIQGKGLVIAEE